MSSLAISSSASTKLPAASFHLHGHKKGWQLDSQGVSSNNSAAQIPVGSLQSLFSNLLQTLEKVVGVQSTAATAATTATAGPSATGTTVAIGTTGAMGGAPSTQSSNASLQNFLNSLLQNLQANGLQSPKLTGSSVNTSV
jgi:hypothetical protein